MKSAYLIIILFLNNVILNAMSFLQVPPPPPPDPNAGGLGGNNTPIDGILIFLALTSISFMVYYYNLNKKKAVK